MTKKEKELAKKAIARQLRFFPEASSLSFGFGASCILGLAFLLFSFDTATLKFKPTMIIIGCVFIVEGLLSLLARKLVEKQVIGTGKVNRATRLFGFILLLTIVNINIFVAIGGLHLIKEKKNTEYLFGSYMLLEEVMVIIVSCINLLKEYVVDTFYTGIALFAGIVVVHAICLVVISNIDGNKAPKKYLPFGIILVLTALDGNILSLVVGLMVIAKCFARDENVSIGWVDVVKRLLKSKTAMLGAFIVVFLICVSICANMTFDYNLAADNDYMHILTKPCLEFPFGTDNYGRCVFTRVIFGARISLSVGFFSVGISLVLGVVLGTIAGYYSGTIENVIMRILDVFMAIPGILLQIAIISALGSSVVNMVIALSFGGIPGYARTVRASILQLSGQEFVEAARACGAKDRVIMFKHMLPNSLAPPIVRMTLGIGGAVTSVSSLSYLGIGIQPQIPEWGNVLKAGSAYLETDPYIAIYPGFAIMLLVLSFNFLGDGLRDALDPKLK
ncbi:MAG: ABC transporter permease [Firmicutes bacterium]|nr:ABC transporter permease [Bacillota bacterium]